MAADKKKIVIIGPYPPPFGGVSIHILRLRELLKEDCSIEIIDESRIRKIGVFNIRSGDLVGYLKRIYAADIVHIHSGLLSLRSFHFIMSSLLFKKKIITIHGYEPGRGFFEKKMDWFMSKNSMKTIFVSREIAECFGNREYPVLNAFLPPSGNEEKDLPGELQAWISERRGNGYVICSANAWRLDMHDGQDMYGVDLCIYAAIVLKRQAIKASFVFIVCEDSGKMKLETYRKLIAENDLGNIFCLYEAPVSFIRLIKESDIIIRPTNTDGDALTIREGLHFGKKVIASDVVQRPEGVILFENRNFSSLADAIRTELGSEIEYADAGNADRAGTDEYVKIYRSSVYDI